MASRRNDIHDKLATRRGLDESGALASPRGQPSAASVIPLNIHQNKIGPIQFNPVRFDSAAAQ